MKYSAKDIANFFISLYKYDEEHPTNLKLNKLVYYAQGHSLARNGRPLFDEEIEAWPFGPVVPSVYHTFKVCGDEGIENLSDDLPVFQPEDEDLLIDVARKYGKYTGGTLTSMTHKNGSPWEKVYVEGQHSTVISRESINEYFKNTEGQLSTIDEELGELDTLEWNDVI